MTSEEYRTTISLLFLQVLCPQIIYLFDVFYGTYMTDILSFGGMALTVPRR